MAVSIVVGGQAGDEAKGIEVQRLSREAAMVFRFGGAHNAGHTCVVRRNGQDEALRLHLFGSATANEGVEIGIGPGTVVYPVAFMCEALEIQRMGIAVLPRTTVDQRCGIMMPWHILFDSLQETLRSKNGAKKIGTTGSGVGPAHEDITGRYALKMYDLQHPERYRELLAAEVRRNQMRLDSFGLEATMLRDVIEAITETTVNRNQSVLTANLINADQLDLNRLFRISGKTLCFDFEALEQFLQPYIEFILDHKLLGDLSQKIEEHLANGDHIIAEGSQGLLLDNLFGTGPYVTSGRTLAGAACCGAGFGPMDVEEVRVIFKAVFSRVGEGPLPTKIDGGEIVRVLQGDGSKIDDERGATSGRVRDIGVLDAVVARRACQTNGANTISLTKLDKVHGRELTRIAVAYIIDGQRHEMFPADYALMEHPEREVIYQDFQPWDADITGCRDWDDLPPKAQDFVLRFEQLVNENRLGHRHVKVDRIGTGPGLDDVIVR